MDTTQELQEAHANFIKQATFRDNRSFVFIRTDESVTEDVSAPLMSVIKTVVTLLSGGRAVLILGEDLM